MGFENEDFGSSLKTLTLAQVAILINAKDNDTAKKWLNENGIQIHKRAGKPFVYEIEVSCEMDRPYVINLRNKFPHMWKELYRATVKDISVYNLLIFLLDNEIQDRPIPKIKAKDEYEERIINELLK